MGYNEQLAARLRTVLRNVRGVTERRMFGGIAFLVRGNMCCGVIGERLIVRVGPEAYETALRRAHATAMDFSGKPLRGFVYVRPEGTRTARLLRVWVDRGLRFVRGLPPK